MTIPTRSDVVLMAMMGLSPLSLMDPPPRAFPGGCTSEAEEALSPTSMNAADAPSWVEPGMPPEVWRLVEASTAVDDEDRSKCLLEAAEAEARLHAAETPGSVPRRFAVVVVLGLRADRSGGRTKVRAASALHEELQAVLATAPEHARARHILGRLHAGVMRMDRVTRWIATNLLGGGALKEATWDGAEENLAFAESRVPDVAEHHYELARLYQDTDRDGLAVQEARHVLALQAASPMEEEVRLKALELLDDLEEGAR